MASGAVERRPSSSRSDARRRWIVGARSSAIVVVDQLTKSWAVVGARRRPEAGHRRHRRVRARRATAGARSAASRASRRSSRSVAIIITIVHRARGAPARPTAGCSSGSCSCSAARSATSSTGSSARPASCAATSSTSSRWAGARCSTSPTRASRSARSSSIVRTLFRRASRRVARAPTRESMTRADRRPGRARRRAASTARSRSSPAGAAPTCRRCSTTVRCSSTGAPVAKSHRLVDGHGHRAARRAGARRRRPSADPTVDVDVRYADDDVIVVAKPAGLVVHPGAGHADGTLVNGLLALYPGDRGGRRPDAARHRAPARPRHERAARRGALARARTTRSSTQLARRTRRAPVRRARVGRLGVAARRDRRADRPVDGAPHAHGGARRGQAGAHRVRGAARRSTRRCARCSTAGSRPAARTRSACTSSAIGHPVVGDGTYGGARDQIAARPAVPARRRRSRSTTRHRRTRASFDEPLPAELAADARRTA